MHPALLWSWLILVVNVPLFWLWSRRMLDAAMGPDGEQAGELFTWGVRVHFLFIVMVMAALVVGGWATGKARDSVILRQAAGIYAAQLLVDCLTYAALLGGALVYDSVLLDYSPLVSLVLALCAGAFVILHAQREGARGMRLLIPILAHVGVALMAASPHITTALGLEPAPDFFRYLSPCMELFYWLSWLAIPRAALSIDAVAAGNEAHPPHSAEAG